MTNALEGRDWSQLTPIGTELSDITKFLTPPQDEADTYIFRRYTMMNVLLEASGAPFGKKDNSRGNFWLREAEFRAQTLLYLMLLLDQRSRRGNVAESEIFREYNSAMKLANAYNSLHGEGGSRTVECNHGMLDIIVGLTTLFGRVAGAGTTEISLQVVGLPPEKHRALALLASGLVLQTLTHCSKNTVGSRLDISLKRRDNISAQLRVISNIGLSSSMTGDAYSTVCALAGLLESDLMFTSTDVQGTRIDVIFPALPAKKAAVLNFHSRG